MKQKLLYLLVPLLFMAFGVKSQETVVTRVEENTQIEVDPIDGGGWAKSVATSTSTGNIYWGYIGPSNEGMVMKIEPDGTTSTHQVMSDVPNDNSHAEISIAVDNDGYIHWIGGQHNNAPNYYRSTNAEDITSWEELDSDYANGGLQGERITYQQFFRSKNGTLFIMYRNNLRNIHSYWGMRTLLLAKYSTTDKKWTMIGGYDYCTQSDGYYCGEKCGGDYYDIIAFAWNNSAVGNGYGEGNCVSRDHYQGYIGDIVFDDDNGMHVTYNLADSINVDYGANPRVVSKSMTHVFYAYSPDEGDTWYKADSSQINTFPITKASGDLVYERCPDGYTFPDLNTEFNMSNAANIFMDTNGDPVIYQKAFDSGNNQVNKFFRWNGSQWADISNNYHMSDGGDVYTNLSRGEMYYFAFGGIFQLSNDNMATYVSYDDLMTSSTFYGMDEYYLMKEGGLRYVERSGNNAQIVTLKIEDGVARPVISPNEIIQAGGIDVSLSTETSGASMRYTVSTYGTESADPTPASGTLYEGPFNISQDALVKAIAYKSGIPTSNIASRKYIIAPSYSSKASISSVTASDAQSPNVASNTIDGDFLTRWSAEGDQWIQYDLGEVVDIYAIYIAFIKGDARSSIFDLEVSDDGNNWTTVKSNVQSSGESLDYEKFLIEVQGRYLRVYGHGNTSSDWNSYAEVEIWEGASEPSTVAISPSGGFYNGSEELTLSSTVSGLDIYYTTDGSAVTTSSNLYSGPFTISGAYVMVKAAGMDPSTNYYEQTVFEKYYVASGDTTIQAENFDDASGVSSSSATSGYNGDGYADYGDAGTWAEWTYLSGAEETVTLSVRYANGSSYDRSCKLYVNGVEIHTFNFGSTGGWGTWETLSTDISVTEGAVKIKLIADPTVGPNIDQLSISGSIPPSMFTLSTTSIDGTVALDPAGGSYKEGTTVTATASANTGYLFTGWSGASTSTETSVDILMDMDKSLTANFAVINSIPYTSSSGTADVNIYPNPAGKNKNINIEISGFGNVTNTTIAIMDVSGRIAYSANVTAKENTVVSHELTECSLASGMYIVTVRSNNKIVNKRFVIE